MISNININLIVFDSVIFDKENKTMNILDGTKGIYSYKDIVRYAILNEKSKYRGKGEPFTALVPKGMGFTGFFVDQFLFVGIKISMNDGKILAIYISKEKTQVGTDQYIRDKKEAEKICEFLEKVVEKYQNKETD